ncbi:MAG: monomeric [FeFe] hydrogenase [Cellulosilyticaceae bacterium]
MRAFETDVQWIRYEVLKKVIQKTITGEFETTQHRIPKEIIPGNKPISRCCVYHEREIIGERTLLASEPMTLGEGIITTIESACDECSAERYAITDSCRGCFAHRCMQVCKKGAIKKVDGKAKIDYSLCVSCGKCKEVCPFEAIVDNLKPCIKACKGQAIKVQEDNKVAIDYEKCMSCGACVYQCPFGALSDRSEIVLITKLIEKAKVEEDVKVYAVIAPAIVTQYNANIGQIVAAIKQIGFTDVLEAALGADLVAYHEGAEFIDKVVNGEQSCMMTSCCPAFVTYVEKHYPELTPLISTMVSPMIATARLIKQIDHQAEVVFIGPCMAKKEEKLRYAKQGEMVYAMTFEELEALIDAYGINVESCVEEPLNNASYFGRLFAKSGGVAEAVATIIEERKVDSSCYRPLACNGLQEVDKALKIVRAKRNTFNFIEGMACVGGCIGGAACLTHDPRKSKNVEEYAKKALEKNIPNALRVVDTEHLNLHKHF